MTLALQYLALLVDFALATLIAGTAIYFVLKWGVPRIPTLHETLIAKLPGDVCSCPPEARHHLPGCPLYRDVYRRRSR